MDLWIPVLVAVVTGLFSLWGSTIAGKRQTKDLQAELAKNQAVFEAVVTEKIGGLTREVEKHNSVIARTYELETAALRHEDELKRLNKRLEKLEEEE